ncbi:hypothetical protein GQM09_27590, partial [Escherichia coli]|nr:hypothetical protein [Escherichia coli]
PIARLGRGNNPSHACGTRVQVMGNLVEKGLGHIDIGYRKRAEHGEEKQLPGGEQRRGA